MIFACCRYAYALRLLMPLLRGCAMPKVAARCLLPLLMRQLPLFLLLLMRCLPLLMLPLRHAAAAIFTLLPLRFIFHYYAYAYDAISLCFLLSPLTLFRYAMLPLDCC